MQQFFTNVPLYVGQDYIFTKEQAHHAKDVVRLDHETVRLVYDGKGFYAKAMMHENQFIARIFEEDTRVNEMQCELTLALALIRKEKFEFVLQKACELGVKRIVPFVSSRCIVHPKKEKLEKQKARWQTIVLEAAQQCKRNQVPIIEDILCFDALHTIKSEGNYACYENAYGEAMYLTDCAKNKKSMTIVIGCEGGFSKQEVEQMHAMGYASITLGSRILRAETAALYACSVISEMYEVHG